MPSPQPLAEQRWPAVAAVAVMLVLDLLTPATFVPKAALVVVAAVLFIPLLVLNPQRLTRETRWSRSLSIGLAVLLAIANQVDLVWIIHNLISGSVAGLTVLWGALQVWVSSVITFALIYWELDRGGPVARGTLTRDELQPADFKFPQDEDSASVREVERQSSEKSDWRPGFVDYLYTSATNMMAFSPTDVMPLSPRAKLFMMLQSIMSYILLALVIARSVNILS
jgi:uncharacterized membrane protein